MKLLVVEPHPYHYEVVAGVVKYFIDMRYDITILVRENFDEEDVLCRLKEKAQLKIKKYNDDSELKKELMDKSIEEYDYVFFSSLEYFHDGKKDRIIDFLGGVPKTKRGFLGIYHNLNMISDKEMQYLKEGRIFTLSEFNYKGIETPILSTHLFGKFEEKTDINPKRKIVLIGLSNRRMLVENAVEEMMENNEYEDLDIVVVGKLKWQKDVVKRSISNLVYYICKASKLKTPYNKCTMRSWKNVKLIGTMKFQEMFELIEQSDFIGIILDPCDYQSKPFLNVKTSGSKQLSYGFCKPVIINDRFAKAYGFDNSTGVIYYDDNIYDGLKTIKNMSSETYRNMTLNLKDKSLELYNKSLDNLRKAMQI